jgi:hypothetical protein
VSWLQVLRAVLSPWQAAGLGHLQQQQQQTADSRQQTADSSQQCLVSTRYVRSVSHTQAKLLHSPTFLSCVAACQYHHQPGSVMHQLYTDQLDFAAAAWSMSRDATCVAPYLCICADVAALCRQPGNGTMAAPPGQVAPAGQTSHTAWLGSRLQKPGKQGSHVSAIGATSPGIQPRTCTVKL